MFIEIEDILAENTQWPVRDKINVILTKYLDLKSKFHNIKFYRKIQFTL